MKKKRPTGDLINSNLLRNFFYCFLHFKHSMYFSSTLIWIEEGYVGEVLTHPLQNLSPSLSQLKILFDTFKSVHQKSRENFLVLKLVETLPLRLSGTHSPIVSHALSTARGGLRPRCRLLLVGEGDQEKEKAKQRRGIGAKTKADGRSDRIG